MIEIGTENGFCSHTAAIWQELGYIMMIFKIVIPVILIIIGVFTFGKAVISEDDKEIKRGYSVLIKKCIIAVLIFFLPAIITSIFTYVTDFNSLRDDFDVCKSCMVSPKGDACLNTIAVNNGE